MKDETLIIIDPNGVLSMGRRYPQGTPLKNIPASDAEIAAWKRFKQVGEPEKPAKAGKGKAPEASEEEGK